MSAALEPAVGPLRPARTTSLRRRPPKTLAADAFDLFPNAIMVCDRRGRVVAANARLRAEFGSVDGAAITCCNLLGCGRPGTDLEDDCLTARALERPDELLEVCVESKAGRLRVSAAPLYDDLSHVVVELRRERLAAVARPLRVFTLGRLRVEAGDGELAGEWLDQRPGQLLRYLVCQRHRVAPADAIAEAIWPQSGPAASTSVRHFVHALRERLEPERPKGSQSSYVVCRNGGYALASGHVRVDADEFESAAGRGMAALAAGDLHAAERRLARAARIYDDDFLSDEPYAEWALAERERLRALACNVLRALAEVRAGRPEAAACLERLADMEPFDSDVQRQLITAWLGQGRRSRAARHYQSFRWRLMREFGESPGFELAELAVAAG
jgi:DNA-binding SARP family transcriptional activator